MIISDLLSRGVDGRQIGVIALCIVCVNLIIDPDRQGPSGMSEGNIGKD